MPAFLILKIGEDLCNYFAAGGSYPGVILNITKKKSKPTIMQAIVEVDAAIRNLRPQFSALVPAGAP